MINPHLFLVSLKIFLCVLKALSSLSRINIVSVCSVWLFFVFINLSFCISFLSDLRQLTRDSFLVASFSPYICMTENKRRSESVWGLKIIHSLKAWIPAGTRYHSPPDLLIQWPVFSADSQHHPQSDLTLSSECFGEQVRLRSCSIPECSFPWHLNRKRRVHFLCLMAVLFSTATAPFPQMSVCVSYVPCVCCLFVWVTYEYITRSVALMHIPEHFEH